MTDAFGEAEWLAARDEPLLAADRYDRGASLHARRSPVRASTASSRSDSCCTVAGCEGTLLLPSVSSAAMLSRGTARTVVLVVVVEALRSSAARVVTADRWNGEGGGIGFAAGGGPAAPIASRDE